MRTNFIVLIVGSVLIGVMVSPLSGVVIIPAIVIGAWAHEFAHYLPLVPWRESLYLEVWPFIEIRAEESEATLGHVGGTISTSTPLTILRFATISPLLIYGWIPIAALLVYGFPELEALLPTAVQLVESPLRFGLIIFLVQALAISPADIHHFRNAAKIQQAGSLDQQLWQELN